MNTTLLALLAYMLLQFGIGWWVSRRIQTETDYLVAGRKLGYWLMTFSVFATWFGAETLIGSAGQVYQEGISITSAEPFGYGLCLILMGLIFAMPLWRRKLTTLADLFRERFSTRVERLAALILIPGSILWAAAQVRAFGSVLSSASGTLDVEAAIAIAAGFTILYTAFGGLLADAMTDLIQGLMLIVGIVIVFASVLIKTGGLDAVALALGDSARVQLRPEGSWLAVAEAWAIPVCGSVIATELVGRIIAARSGQVARNASLTAGAIYIAVGALPVILGLVGVRLVANLADPEHLLPVLAHDLLPTVLYTVFAGGLISAILSTVDSTLLVSSGLLSHNLLVPLFRITNEQTKVRVARIGVLSFGLVAYVLAVRAEGVFALVEQASAFGSAGALVTVSFGLFTRWGGARTAASTLVAGVGVYMIAVFSNHPYPFLMSLAAALLVYLTGAVLGQFVTTRTAEWRPGESIAAPQPVSPHTTP
jgi:Na+/proline symporter